MAPTLDEERRVRIRKASAETRLSDLRHDALRYLNIVTAVATLLGDIDTESVEGLTTEYSKWVEQLLEAARDLRDVLDMYAFTE